MAQNTKSTKSWRRTSGSSSSDVIFVAGPQRSKRFLSPSASDVEILPGPEPLGKASKVRRVSENIESPTVKVESDVKRHVEVASPIPMEVTNQRDTGYSTTFVSEPRSDFSRVGEDVAVSVRSTGKMKQEGETPAADMENEPDLSENRLVVDTPFNRPTDVQEGSSEGKHANRKILVEEGPNSILGSLSDLSIKMPLKPLPHIPDQAVPMRATSFPAPRSDRSEVRLSYEFSYSCCGSFFLLKPPWQISSSSSAAFNLFTASTMIKADISRSSKLLEELTALSRHLEMAHDCTEDALNRIETWQKRK
jgi:hypothetical protein